MKKQIEFVVAPPSPHFVGDGFRVHNFIPSLFRLDMKRMDPFILMDYNSKFYFEPSEHLLGVGTHPHRGFETVTIVYEGSVSHKDSSGGGGTIYAGDVQWMTAASGVLHNEFHEEEFNQKGGYFHMVQLWVNLPAKEKMSKPKYQSITNEMIPIVKLDEDGSEVEVIAGSYNQTEGIASTFSPINLLNVRLKAGKTADFEYPANYTTFLLIIEGSIVVNGDEKVPTDHLALFGNTGENFSIHASEDAKILLLSGEPINEPIAAQGPFVMNTKEELIEAYEDFKKGKFGIL